MGMKEMVNTTHQKKDAIANLNITTKENKMTYSTQNDILIGQNIRLIRRARGMTQQKLGDKVGVAGNQIQKYESGENRVAGGRIIQIANVLNVPVIALFPDGTEINQGKACIVFMQAFNELSEDTQHQLKQLVKHLASVGM